jgi:hypothetical protein
MESVPSQGNTVGVVIAKATQENKRKNSMEQKIASPVWVKPTLEVIGVSLECTAYAGASELEE